MVFLLQLPEQTKTDKLVSWFSSWWIGKLIGSQFREMKKAREISLWAKSEKEWKRRGKTTEKKRKGKPKGLCI